MGLQAQILVAVVVVIAGLSAVQGQECDPNICLNGGTCLNDTGTPTCNCPLPYTGHICDTDMTCEINQCLNGGTCINDTAAGTIYCICPPGFSGHQCQIDHCNPNPCVNGGTCERVGGGYNCDCPDGFSGINCEIDHCASSPCQNGGTCVGVGGGFTCDCPDGFDGANCENDRCSPSPCQNGGTCVRAPNGYTCDCTATFFGTNCTETPCFDNACLNGGVCTPINETSYSCNCVLPWTGSFCEHGCNGNCSGDFFCDITDHTCVECIVDANCTADPDRGICDVARRLCIGCFQDDDCPEDYHICMGNECVDACDLLPCFNGICTEDPTGTHPAICECFDGWEGADCNTEVKSNGPCDHEPCVNGACTPMDDSYSCSCDPGWHGTDCDQDICQHTNPCINGDCSVTVPGTDSYSCTCLPGWFGDNCDQGRCEHDNPCNTMGGQCEDVDEGDGNYYRCNCYENFYGDLCDKECNLACVHGACKFDLITGVKWCQCCHGWRGTLCDIKKRRRRRIRWWGRSWWGRWWG